ncbi:hypothetical protein [Luteolibacter marinus]|uniref:hypothetical protein n=1 Tax=Luteolibacter marinus TaxID=2776705 RepID=UPI001867F42E|nr:hypothetical protein [Luteolibacter marinus]
MPESAERFIAAAVRPLGDNAELEMMAAQELRGAILAAGPPAGCDSLDEAAANIGKEAANWRWKSVLYAVTAVVTILVSIPLARDYMNYRLASYALFSMSSDRPALPGLPFQDDVGLRVAGILGDFSPA